MPRNILVLGGTGHAGQRFTERYADGDNMLFIVTRKPDNYNGFQNDNVKPIGANIFDTESLKGAITDNGIEVVVCMLGFGNIDAELEDGTRYVGAYEKHYKALVPAMEATSCKRLISVSTWFGEPAQRNCCAMGCPLWCLLRCTFLGPVLAGLWIGEDPIKSSSLDYTVCRAPILEMAPAPENKQGFVTAFDAAYVPSTNYYAGSFDDLARFMYQAIDTDDYKKKVVAFGRENSGWCCCMC